MPEKQNQLSPEKSSVYNPSTEKWLGNLALENYNQYNNFEIIEKYEHESKQVIAINIKKKLLKS